MKGDYVLEFGKQKTVAQVATDHADYVQWAAFKEDQGFPATVPPWLNETSRYSDGREGSPLAVNRRAAWVTF